MICNIIHVHSQLAPKLNTFKLCVNISDKHLYLGVTAGHPMPPVSSHHNWVNLQCAHHCCVTTNSLSYLSGLQFGLFLSIKRYLVDVCLICYQGKRNKCHLLNTQGGGSHQTAWSEVTIVRAKVHANTTFSNLTAHAPSQTIRLIWLICQLCECGTRHMFSLHGAVLHYDDLLQKDSFRSLISVCNFGLTGISDWNYIYWSRRVVLACAKAPNLT